LFPEKQKAEKVRDYSWLNRMGETGRFIALELRLIWRNKRPRSVAMMTVAMLLYRIAVLQGPKWTATTRICIYTGRLHTGRNVLHILRAVFPCLAQQLFFYADVSAS